jgi:hypothetical protein
VTPPRAALRCAGAEASLKVALRAASATTSSGPVREQHGQRLHEHRRGGGVQRRRLLQPTLNQPQRRIGAGTRALAQATDHLDRRGSSASTAASASIRRPRSQMDRANAPVRRNTVGPWAARQTPISAAADASSCFAQRSSSLPASIASELDLGEGYRWFDLLVAGWLRALPHPARRLILEVDAFDACGDRHPRGDSQNPEELPTRFRVLARRLVGQDEACCRSPTAV